MTTWVPSEWRWLWSELRPYRLHQTGALACTILSTAIGLTVPLIIRWLIDDVLPSRHWWALVFAVIAYWAASFSRSLVSAVGQFVTSVAVQRLVLRVRMRLLGRLQSLSPTFYATYPIGDLVQRFERDVNLIGELGSDILPSAIRIVLEMTLTTAVLLYLDWRMAVVIVPLLPLFAALRHRFGGSLKRHAEEVRESMGRQSSLFNDLLTGVLQVQLLGAERRLGRRYYRLGLQGTAKVLAQRREELTFMLWSMGVISLGMTLIVGYGGSRVMSGSLTVGSLVAFYTYLGSIFTPMTLAVELYARLIRVRASIRRISEIEQANDGLGELADMTALSAPVRSLHCVGVSFAYQSNQRVLRQVDLSVEGGDRIALVGESGCGKSTLLKLLPRLYEPDEGRIEIDGRDIRKMSLCELRRMLAVVPQDPVLFEGTLRDNLRLALPGASLDEITRAAWVACLTDVVRAFPSGWETMLGPGGAGVSGGERQRIAIARALLQRRPILILDEATSALDPKTEKKLLARLKDWCHGRLTIVVSHRIEAARWADRVVVLRSGRVVEDGAHHRLHRPGTHYYELWQRAAAADVSDR